MCTQKERWAKENRKGGGGDMTSLIHADTQKEMREK
jgi:hypothetical protein